MELDPEEWEAEQKRLDREWYGLDDGYDADASQAFGGVSEEYTQRKEEQLEQKKRKRVSAKQKQIQKDNELWERNRMLTSGVVTTIDVDEDYEEEAEARVHLLVHNIVPPFLDGRYVFTKQPEAVVPVRVSNTDLAKARAGEIFRKRHKSLYFSLFSSLANGDRLGSDIRFGHGSA